MTTARQRFPLAHLAAALALGLAAAAPAQAQTYPNKPIRLIVPFAPGGSTDIIARLVGERMARELGQPVVIENRGGGGGSIGASEAARAAPDGYVLSVATVSTMAVNPACNAKLPYDPLKDFTPITNLANTANVVAVNPNMPAKTMETFVEELRNNPNKYSYGTSGPCSVNHLAGEAFREATGADIVHVPYRGSGPAVVDTVAGQVQILFDNIPSSMAQIEAGRLHPIAVAWPQRLESLPNVPTYAEAGYPQLNQPVWYGLLAPAGTPREVIDTVRNAAVKVLAEPEVIESLAKQGAAPSGNTPDEFAAEIKAQHAWAADVARKQGISLEQ
ncbi:MAG: tripartite tricarboxylate transporter substrate binding protein BugE [Pigmentiphaga sp.]